MRSRRSWLFLLFLDLLWAGWRLLSAVFFRKRANMCSPRVAQQAQRKNRDGKPLPICIVWSCATIWRNGTGGLSAHYRTRVRAIDFSISLSAVQYWSTVVAAGHCRPAFAVLITGWFALSRLSSVVAYVGLYRGPRR